MLPGVLWHCVQQRFSRRYSARSAAERGAHESYEAWRFVASSAVEVGPSPADGLYRERVDAHQHRHRPADSMPPGRST